MSSWTPPDLLAQDGVQRPDAWSKMCMANPQWQPRSFLLLLFCFHCFFRFLISWPWPVERFSNRAVTASLCNQQIYISKSIYALLSEEKRKRLACICSVVYLHTSHRVINPPLHIRRGLDFNHRHHGIKMHLRISRKCDCCFLSLVWECAEWRCDVYSAIWFRHLASFVSFSRNPVHPKGVQIHYEIGCWKVTRCGWKQAWLLNASLRDLVLNYGRL